MVGRKDFCRGEARKGSAKLKFYLRMEAVNLQQFMGDCQDLSTIRGGGLLLLHSPGRVGKEFSSLSPIVLGGSIALFEFEAKDQERGEQVRSEVEEFLNVDKQLRHATFVVDTVPVTGDFRQDRNLLHAKNRWRQMQSPSVAVPHAVAPLPCRTDKVRPGDQFEDGEPMSTSVKVRREYGRNQKQAFYADETGLSCPRFVRDLDTLTANGDFGNLHHKMAVIHLDGNGFGKIQEACDSPQALRQFDENLRGLRQDMLRQLLKQAFSPEQEAKWKTPKGEHRMETLLWGGDEFIWVVPAWTGLEVLSFFFSHSKNWRYQNRPLTHAGGIIFCHHHAPIHRITDLAQKLTRYAKNAIRPAEKNVFAWQVLESFDHVGQDLDKTIESRLPQGCAPADFLLAGEQLGNLIGAANGLKSELPRNKVHSIARSFAAKQNSLAEPLAEKTLEQLPKASQDRFHNFAQKIGNEWMVWVHLAELWDYFPE